MNTGIAHLEWLDSVLNSNLPSYAKMLAMYLSTFMNRERIRAWPSISKIIKQTGLSKSSICKYLKVLERAGWINRKTGNANHSTIYQIKYPESSAPCDTGSAPHGHSAPHGPRLSVTRTKIVRDTDTNQQKNQQKNQQILLFEKNTISSIFKKPTLQQVSEYCQQRHNQIDPNQFVDFYESKNWMIGKNKMKNWQAAIRTWERNRPQKNDAYADYM